MKCYQFLKSAFPAMTWEKGGGGGQTVEGSVMGRGCSTGESGSWDTICCLTVNLYNNQLILHTQYVHAPPPIEGSIPTKMTLYKTKRQFLFLYVFF